LDETSTDAVEVDGEWHLSCSASDLEEMLAAANAAAVDAFDAYKARMA
jgi:hypothetical protein